MYIKWKLFRKKIFIRYRQKNGFRYYYYNFTRKYAKPTFYVRYTNSAGKTWGNCGYINLTLINRRHSTYMNTAEGGMWIGERILSGGWLGKGIDLGGGGQGLFYLHLRTWLAAALWIQQLRRGAGRIRSPRTLQYTDKTFLKNKNYVTKRKK